MLKDRDKRLQDILNKLDKLPEKEKQKLKDIKEKTLKRHKEIKKASNMMRFYFGVISL